MDKVLGFCYQKVNNRENAEDLSVEITLEVLQAVSIQNLTEEQYFKQGSFLIMDEPTSALDAAAEEWVQSVCEPVAGN
jgi:ABC-type sugar transport system ATPase subunit